MVAAPAIVRVASIMPVKALPEPERVFALTYQQEAGIYRRYSGYDMLHVSPADVLSRAEYDWNQAAVLITRSGRELRGPVHVTAERQFFVRDIFA